MAGINIETLLSYHSLTAPLLKNPISEYDKTINKLQLKYITYIVEYDFDTCCLQTMELSHLNGAFFLTKGWKAISDFYGIGLGAWITLVFVGDIQFHIRLTNRFHKNIPYPFFDPPMHFLLDKMNLQATFDDYLPPITSLLTYRHNITNMVLDFDKKLTEYDVTKGCMILLYTGNVPQMLDTLKTTVNIIDDCGNIWVCELTFATIPYEHFKIGGCWKRFVEARRLRQGVKTENEGRKSRVIDVTLQDLENNRLHCSLWGEHANRIVSFFVNHDNSSPVVLILQFCKTCKYLGAMGIANAFYGTKLILNDDLPEVAAYIAGMKKASLQLTQTVSQISTSNSASLSDDLLNTERMTIESMIESTQVCQGSVLATICEIETGVEWYFRSCTQCATLVTVDNGMLRCRKCKPCKSAVPRFKLHVIVMDDTGSATFVLFDRQVTRFIGRNVQDLINEHDKGEGACDYPPDFNVLIDKQVLFKVEVGEGNVVKKYRNYIVKKASDDVGVIEQFISKYNLEKPNDGSVEELSLNGVATNNYNVEDLHEAQDSCSNTCVIGTPTSKTSLKRSSDSIDSVAVEHGEAGQASVTKPNRAVRVKVEPKDTRVV